MVKTTLSDMMTHMGGHNKEAGMKGINNKLKKQFWYAWYFKYARIREKTVLYQAYRNNIMGGNPYGIFCELMGDPEYKDYTHIWVYKNEENLEDDTFQKFSEYPNVIYVKNGTEEYYRSLASCEYLISNAAFPQYWIKKKGQVYINTWHGTPLKTLGRQAKDRNFSSIINAQRNFFQCDYMVMPNRYTVDRMMEAYDLKGLFPGQIIDAGYPRTDLVLNTEKGHIIKILERKLRVSLKGKKLVLYAPTFRSVQGQSVNTSRELGNYMKALMDMLPPDYELVFKVHNMMASFFKNDDQMAGRLIFDEIETNELLSVTDVLITDYSSIFFDFLCRKKPILFFVYDRQEYEDGRGLYRPLEELPGPLCERVEDLKDNFRRIEEGIFEFGENFENYLKEFAYNDDGMAARRTVDIIFRRKSGMERYIIPKEQDKENILVLADLILTAEKKWTCVSVLKELDYEKNTVVLLAGNGFSLMEDWEAISEDIRLVAADPAFLMTPLEKVCHKLFHTVPGRGKFLQRQYKRYFGSIPFSKIYDIDWNHSIWKEILKKYCSQYVTVPRPHGTAQRRELRRKVGHKMTALFVAAYDSVNYVFVNIIRELQNRDYGIMLVVLDAESSMNTKMFSENQIPFTDIEKFDFQALLEVDFAFLAPFQSVKAKSLYYKIEKHKIFCISFATLFSSVTMRVYTDLIFTIGTSKFQEYEENGLHYSMVAVGSPQYDDLVRERDGKSAEEKKEIRRVLFIDQGGYPFGQEGKKLLGQVLLAMALCHPEKEFVVKPRYLPEEVKESVLHRPSEHLYDFILDPPDNLCLLRESTILENIIGDYDAVVTMWSTAYLDASLMGLPIMLIRGLPSEEVFDVRNQRIQEAYERLEHTGCVVDYQEVLEGKLEFCYVDGTFLSEEVENTEYPCAPEIVDTLEELYEQLIIPEKRFGEVFQMDIRTFRKDLPDLKLIDLQSDCYKKRREFIRQFNKEIQELVYHNRCMAKPFDLQPLQEYWDFYPDSAFSERDLEGLISRVSAEIDKIQEDFFCSGQIDMEKDPIRLDFYFDWLFRKGDFDEIFYCENPHVLIETRAFYESMVYFVQGKYDEAAERFSVYYHHIQKIDVKPLHKDRQIYFMFFPRTLECAGFFRALYIRKEYGLLKEMGEVQRFNVHMRTYYLLKVLEDEQQIEELQRAYGVYINGVKQPKAVEIGSEGMTKLDYYQECIKIGERH